MTGEISQQRLLRPKEAASELGISVAQLIKLTKDGEIAYINLGRGTVRPARRYHPADIQAFIDRRKS